MYMHTMVHQERWHQTDAYAYLALSLSVGIVTIVDVSIGKGGKALTMPLTILIPLSFIGLKLIVVVEIKS